MRHARLLALAVLLPLASLTGCGDPVATDDGAVTQDLAVAADLTTAGDMAKAPVPDMVMLPDLTPQPDLTPLPDMVMLPPTVLAATLTGSQEVPPVTTMANGTATISVSGDKQSIDVTITSALLATSTASHIHFGRPGNNGGVLFALSSGAQMAMPYKKTLTAMDLTPVMGGPQNFADAVDAILTGQTYMNVHTMGNPGGEIRGHVGGITFTAALSGQQEYPPTGASAGTVKIVISNAQDQIDVTIDAGMAANITASHIHAGSPGRNGPVILATSAAFMGMTSKTLKAADLMASAPNGINTFSDAIVAILSGGAYANVHTMANPGGEMRGALGAVTLRSTLSALQEVPANASTATGGGITTIDADQKRINMRLEVANIMNTTAAHYHVSSVGSNGGVIFGLSAGAVMSPLTKSLTSVDLMPQMAQNINTFGDAVNAMLAGRVYMNVHTMANPGGEIRGQVGPVLLKSTLAGANEVPPVMTMATGTSTVIILGDQSAIDVSLTTTGLVNSTAAHIHFGVVGMNGPVIFTLGGAAFASPLRKTLLPADLAPSMANGVNTFADAINAIIGQKTYENAHTMGNAGGEIRGQITP